MSLVSNKELKLWIVDGLNWCFMLNASYNLPSEDCNTEKQMVFHSNKLLCVYSLQSWLSETFTFCSELPCCWQARRGAASHGGASCAGGTQPGPQGSSWGSDQNTGKCCAPDTVGTHSSGLVLGAGAKRNCLFLEAAHLPGHSGSYERCPQHCCVWQSDPACTAGLTVLELSQKCRGDELLCFVGVLQ